MKTVFIYDSLGEEPLTFFVLDGDYSYLDKIYINSSKESSYEEELINLTFDADLLDDFPTTVFNSNEKVFVIVVGFVP